jgi:folate-binding protein YgfZ
MSQIAEVTSDASYAAAKSGLAFYQIPNPGTLLFAGATRIEYLQRQTTNDLGLLTPASVVPNMLTNASGRILEVFTLVAIGDQIALLTQPGHAPGLAAYFKKHIFFNDQVTIEDASTTWSHLELRGPQTTHALTSLGFNAIPNLDGLASSDFNGQTIFAFGIDSFDTHPAFMLFVPSGLADLLTATFAQLNAVALAPASRELFRIEARLPGDHEFTDANTPFELGLARYVSATKGCYTGQEVLARQVTYDKIVRQLSSLSSSEPIPVGSAVQIDGKTLGNVSSAAISPARGPLALAVLRKPFASGDTVSITNSGSSLTATIL